MRGVVAVVLNWNRRDETRACLEALARSKDPPRTIVVDNGSTECPPADLVRGLAGGFPSLDVVSNPTNEGYARGNNVGIARALAVDASAVWIVTNDVQVEPDAGELLAAALEADPTAAAVGPSVFDLRRPGVLSNAGGRVLLWRGRTAHLHEGLPAAPTRSPYPVDFVEGCAVLLRADDLRAQGGFDPAYGAYWEDVDWCLAARARGRRVLVVPEARVHHRVAASSGVVAPYALYHRARNRFRCVRRHAGPFTRAAAGVSALAELPLELLHIRRAGGGREAGRAWIRGTVDGLLGRAP